MLMSRRTLEKADGMLIFTPESYEPEAVAATRAWYAETGRPVYTTGPLLPTASKSTAMANEKKMSSESNAIVDFLDETLKTSGEKSLVYVSRCCDALDSCARAQHCLSKISFGTIFWPVMTPEKLWAWLDVLMELNIPFVSLTSLCL